MGLAPTLLPGRVSEVSGRDVLEAEWGPLPEGRGRDATGILEGLRDGELKALLLLGTDPVRDHPAPRLAREALEKAELVVAFDHYLTDSSRLADVVFPVEGFAEVEGTATNIEGRVQKVNRLVPGPGQTRAAWSVLEDLARRLGGDLGAPSAATLAKEIERVAPAYHGVSWDVLDWGEGREGVVLPVDAGAQQLEYIPVDVGLPATDAKYAVHLGRVMYDDGVRVRMSPSLAALAPAAAVHLNPEDAAELGLEAGAVASIEGENGNVTLPVALDRSLGRGTVYVPANLAATADLGASVAVVITAGEQP